MSGGTRKDGPGGGSGSKTRYQNPRGGYGSGGGGGGMGRHVGGKMGNSHCMPAPVQLQSIKRSNDDFESLLPQGGGAVGGASGWSKEGKDEDDKATKPEKREEGWKKPEAVPSVSHGFPKDEFPSLMEQEKLPSKEKEELGKHHHQQEALPSSSNESRSRFLRHDSLPRSSGSSHSVPPTHPPHHHYPPPTSLNYRDPRTRTDRASHHRHQPRGPRQRHLPYPPPHQPHPQPHPQSSDPYMSYFFDMAPPTHSAHSSSNADSAGPDERRRRDEGRDPLPTSGPRSLQQLPDDDEDEGWAGHHEDIDYSKEVVFEDSSDEDDHKRRNESDQNWTKDESIDDKPARARKGGVSPPPTHVRRDRHSNAEDWYHPRPYHHGNDYPHQRYRDNYWEHEGRASRPHPPPLILKKDRSSPVQLQNVTPGIIDDAPPTPETPPTRNAPKKILMRDLADDGESGHAPQSDSNRLSDQSDSRVKTAWGPVPPPPIQPLNLGGGAKRDEGERGGGGRHEDKARGTERSSDNQSMEERGGERRPSQEDDDGIVYDIRDRGPIASDKILYEPEGKASEEKFKKYHRMSSSDSTGGHRTGSARGNKNDKPDKPVHLVPSPDDVFTEDVQHRVGGGGGHHGRPNQQRRGGGGGGGGQKRFPRDSPPSPQHPPSPLFNKEDKPVKRREPGERRTEDKRGERGGDSRKGGDDRRGMDNRRGGERGGDNRRGGERGGDSRRGGDNRRDDNRRDGDNRRAERGRDPIEMGGDNRNKRVQDERRIERSGDARERGGDTRERGGDNRREGERTDNRKGGERKEERGGGGNERRDGDRKHYNDEQDVRRGSGRGKAHDNPKGRDEEERWRGRDRGGGGEARGNWSDQYDQPRRGNKIDSKPEQKTQSESKQEPSRNEKAPAVDSGTERKPQPRNERKPQTQERYSSSHSERKPQSPVLVPDDRKTQTRYSDPKPQREWKSQPQPEQMKTQDPPPERKPQTKDSQKNHKQDVSSEQRLRGEQRTQGQDQRTQGQEQRSHGQDQRTQGQAEDKPVKKSQPKREGEARHKASEREDVVDTRYNTRPTAQKSERKPSHPEASRKPQDTFNKPQDTLSKPQDTFSKPQDTARPKTKPQDVRSRDTTVSKPHDTTSKPQDTTSKPRDTTSKPQDTTNKPRDTTSKPQDTTSKPQDTRPKAATAKPHDAPQDNSSKTQDTRTKPFLPQRPHPDDYEWAGDDQRPYPSRRGRGRRDYYNRHTEDQPPPHHYDNQSFPSRTFARGGGGSGRRGNGRGRRGGGGRRETGGGEREHRQGDYQHSSYYNDLDNIDSESDWEDELFDDYQMNKRSAKEETHQTKAEEKGRRGEEGRRGEGGGDKRGSDQAKTQRDRKPHVYEGADPPLISTPPIIPAMGVVSPGERGKKSDGLLPTPKIFAESILMLGSPVGGAERGSPDNDGFTVVCSSKKDKQKEKDKKRRNNTPKHDEEHRGKGGGAKPPVEQSHVWNQMTPRPPKEVWSETEEKKEVVGVDSDIVVPPTAGQYGAIGDKSSRSHISHRDPSSISHERGNENNYRLFDNNSPATPTFALQPKSSGGELHVLSEAIDSTLTDSFKVKTDAQLDPILEPPDAKPRPSEATPFQTNQPQRQGQPQPPPTSKSSSQDKKKATTSSTSKRSQNNDRFYTPPPARQDGGGGGGGGVRSNPRASSSHRSHHSSAQPSHSSSHSTHSAQKSGWSHKHSKVTSGQTREEDDDDDDDYDDEEEEEGGVREDQVPKSSRSHFGYHQQQHQRGGGGGAKPVATATMKPDVEASKGKIKAEATSLVSSGRGMQSEKAEPAQGAKFGSISYATALKNRPHVSSAEPVRITGQAGPLVETPIMGVAEDIPPMHSPTVTEIGERNSPSSWKPETAPLPVPISPLPVPMSVPKEVANSPGGRVHVTPPTDANEAIQLPEVVPLAVSPSVVVPTDKIVPPTSYPFDIRGGTELVGAEPEGVEMLATAEPNSDMKSNLNITANEFIPFQNSVSDTSNASSSSSPLGLAAPTPLVTTVTGKLPSKQIKQVKTTAPSLVKFPPPSVLASAPPTQQQQQSSLLNQPPPQLLQFFHQLQVAVLASQHQQQQQQQHSISGKRAKNSSSHSSAPSNSRGGNNNQPSSSSSTSPQSIMQPLPPYPPPPPPPGQTQAIPLMVSYPPPPPQSFTTLQNYQQVKSRVQAPPPPPLDIVQTLRPVHATYIDSRSDGIHGNMAPPMHSVIPQGAIPPGLHQGITPVAPATLQAPPTMYHSSHLPPQLPTPSHVFMPPALPAGTGGLPVTFQQITSSLSRVPISTPTHLQSIDVKMPTTIRPPLLPTPPNFNLLVSATPTRPVQTTMTGPSVFAPPPHPPAVWTGMRLTSSLNGSGSAPPPPHMVSPEGHPIAMSHQVV